MAPQRAGVRISRIGRTVAGGSRRHLARLTRLRARDILDLVAAQSALLMAHWHVWRRPTGRLIVPHGTGVTPAHTRSPAPSPRIEQLRVAIARATRFGITRPSCLTRALALMRMLEREGYTGGAVRIGVRRKSGSFEAHAWVDYGGVALDIDPGLSRPFTPLTDARPTRSGEAS